MNTELELAAADPRSPTNLDDEGRTAAKTIIRAVTILGFLAPVALYVWVTAADSLDVLRADQWYDVKLVEHSFHGTLSLSMLWALHNENRIFFQNLLVILVAHLAHLNVLVEVYLNVILLAGATTLFIVTHHRRSPTTSGIWYCPLVIVMFSVAQWGDTLFGFQVGWYLILFMLALALFCLDRPALTWIVLAGAVIAGVVASYSSLQGLLVWPVGLALLLQRARPRRVVYSWIVVGLLTAILYFYNWNTTANRGIPYAIHNPIESFKFYVFALGDILGASISDSPHGAQYAVFAFGLVILGMGIWAIVSSGLRVDQSSGRPVGVALVWTGLLFAVAIAGGRVSGGLSNAGASRYVTFDLLVVAGSYLVAMDRLAQRDSIGADLRFRPIVVVPGVVMALIVALVAIVGSVNGITVAHNYRDFLEVNAVVTANIDRAPDGLVEHDLGSGYEPTGFIRQMVMFTRAHHLALFSTSAAASYAKEQIPVNSTPPTTTMSKPTAGQHLSGGTFLFAGASDPFGVTKVEFELRVGQSGSKVISPGFKASFTWLGGWNTESVPNGQYFLRSVAFAPGGLHGTSRWVAVEVNN